MWPGEKGRPTPKLRVRFAVTHAFTSTPLRVGLGALDLPFRHCSFNSPSNLSLPNSLDSAWLSLIRGLFLILRRFVFFCDSSPSSKIIHHFREPLRISPIGSQDPQINSFSPQVIDTMLGFLLTSFSAWPAARTHPPPPPVMRRSHELYGDSSTCSLPLLSSLLIPTAPSP
jgi:hypothetical protein